MAYLITVSFLLHFVTFFIIVILIQKLNAKNTHISNNEQGKIKIEIEDLLVAYTTEMKEENEKLLKQITTKRKVIEEKQRVAPIIEQHKNIEKIEKKQAQPFIKRPVETFEETVYTPPIIEQTEDIVEQSTTAKILSLSNQGYSSKDIAKKLGMGDGEVELLLKFHK